MTSRESFPKGPTPEGGYDVMTSPEAVAIIDQMSDVVGFSNFMDTIRYPLLKTPLYQGAVEQFINVARHNAYLEEDPENTNDLRMEQASRSFRYGEMTAAYFAETYLDEGMKSVMVALATTRFRNVGTAELKKVGPVFLDEAFDTYLENPVYHDFVDNLVLRARNEEEQAGLLEGAQKGDKFKILDSYFFKVGFGAILRLAHAADVGRMSQLIDSLEQDDIDQQLMDELQQLIEDQ